MLGLAAALLTLASSSVSGAVDCDTASPWIEVQVTDAIDGVDADELVLDLRAGLAPRGIEVCAAGSPDPARPPLALVQFQPTREDHYQVSVEIGDRVTGKRSRREVPLGELAPDSRALTLSIAADELLRASWAELAMADARELRASAPDVVVKSVDEDVSATTTHAWLGAGFSYAHYGGGQDHFGAELRTSLEPWRWFGVELVAGARRGLSVRSASGRITATAAHVGLRGTADLTPDTARWGLGLSAGLDAIGVFFAGRDPAADAVANRATDVAVLAELSVVPRIELTPRWRVVVPIGAGLPVRAVRARDRGAIVTGLSGYAITAGLGIQARLTGAGR